MLLKQLSSINSPLLQEQVDKLKQLTSELNTVQLAWVGGYLSAAAELATTDSAPQASLTILYGSQTGNSRGIAKDLAQTAQAQGYQVNIVSMGDYKVRQLKQESMLIAIVSTHGEGEAPDDAIELHQFLASKRAPRLEQLNYSVLALGDSSYEFFCQTGKDFDQRLAALGARAILPIVTCDVDYETTAKQWQQNILETVKPLLQPTGSSVVPITSAANLSDTSYSKQHPYNAELLLSQKLTGRESDRDIRHVELDLGESNIRYQVGDSLGIWFTNAEDLVDEIIEKLSLDPQTQVMIDEQSFSLRQALSDKRELTQINATLVQNWARLSHSESLQAIAKDGQQTRQFVLTHQLADLIKLYPIEIPAAELIALLRPITPRLYSIASSQAEVEAEVHLTVAVVKDDHTGTMRYGGASNCLATTEIGNKIKVYIEPNSHFRLPDNPQTPVIMVGPGTGVAPFRAFMQQRAQQENNGKSWLFFGNPHFEQDFLYQTEWQQYLQQGALTHLDSAFSRDQPEKIYVQHRIASQGEVLWQWLQDGAHLYVCGDANAMAKDVHQAFVALVMHHGEMSKIDADNYLDTLRREKRYQKDVY